MGKLRRGRKNQRSRVNPMAGKKTTDKQEIKDEATRQSKILPMINKLKSTTPSEKQMAIGAVSILCEDERMRKLMLKERLIAIVMEHCLNDDHDEIATEAFGLLRNVGIEEGYDITKFYWRSNVWTSIEAALNKIQSSFQYLSEKETTKETKRKEDKNKLQLLFDFTENVLSLIVVIASGSEDLFNNIYNKIDPIIKLVIDIINWNTPNLKTSLKLQHALLDFLYEFSSESIEFIQKLSQINDFNLDNISNNNYDDKLCKVYIEGIRFHINEGLGITNDKNNLCSFILNNLFKNITTINVNEINEQLQIDNANDPIQKPNTEVDQEEPQDIDQELGGDSPEKTKAKSELQALEVAIEITTSIWEYLSINESDIKEPVQLSEDLNNTIIKVASPSLIELIRLDQQNNGYLELSDKVLKSLNNICWLFLSSATIPVQWFEDSLQLWDMIIQLSNKDNLYLQKDCLSVLWAIAKTIGPEAPKRVNSDMINTLINKCNVLVQQSNESEDVQLNFEYVLVTIGFLGTIAPVIGNTEITKKISEFLIQSTRYFAPKENNKNIPQGIEIAIESLNLIYDIFGDKFEYDDEIFVQGNYVNILTELEQPIKTMYKNIDKFKEPELKIRAEEVWTNLGRFIQYKISEADN